MPSRSVGNTGRVQRTLEVVDPETGRVRMGISRPSGGGGSWNYYFCEPCNNRTERWEGEYRSWVMAVFGEMQNSKPAYGSGIGIKVAVADVGAVGRVFWGWMFALVPELRTLYPDAAQAILSGDSCEPPDAYRILLATTPDLRLWTLATDQSDESFPEGVANAAVASPPFVVVLADADYDAEGWLDVSHWLRIPAGAQHAAELRLRVIQSHDTEVPGSDLSLADAENRWAVRLLPPEGRRPKG